MMIYQNKNFMAQKLTSMVWEKYDVTVQGGDLESKDCHTRSQPPVEDDSERRIINKLNL